MTDDLARSPVILGLMSWASERGALRHTLGTIYGNIFISTFHLVPRQFPKVEGKLN